MTDEPTIFYLVRKRGEGYPYWSDACLAIFGSYEEAENYAYLCPDSFVSKVRVEIVDEP